MRRGSGVPGFTLAEMLVAISIMLLIVGITVPLFVSSRSRSRRVDAVNVVKAALAAARQSAVERRTAVAVEFVSDSSSPNRGDYMLVWDKSFIDPPDDRQIGEAVDLPDFIKFEVVPPVGALVDYWTLENGWQGDPDDLNDASGDPVPANRYPDIAYKPDGTGDDEEGTTDIVLFDTTDNIRTVLRVLPATGLIVEARHVERLDLPEGPTNPRRKGWL